MRRTTPRPNGVKLSGKNKNIYLATDFTDLETIVNCQ